ncbi:hypothetical protein F975_01876 [Acinetobacter sp. ANC 3789]|uniref:hypothetical protein n=1 Tax=Acinetobacter sp. ANC 3789 TaxID=1217714 RepID=UPI0002CE46C4|nr:hypothetical protein [Acinetobacter sp. ANC 3789]ENU80123.1 hypothetical protein F975_01876 [Acinetobacter sp. ANC 3789]
MAYNPKKNKNNNQVVTTIIGLVVTVVLAYYISEFIKSKREASATLVENMSKPDNTNEQNELIRLKNLAEQKQLQEKQNAVPFKKKVMYFFRNQEPAVGKITFEAENYDVVFTVRDKATNKIAAVIQLPQDRTAELNVPLGDYSVNYALPNGGTWQGLENLWGTFTSYHDSNKDFLISRENTVNGYVIHNSGIKCCHQTVVASNRHISKSEFFGGS